MSIKQQHSTHTQCTPVELSKYIVGGSSAMCSGGRDRSGGGGGGCKDGHRRASRNLFVCPNTIAEELGLSVCPVSAALVGIRSSRRCWPTLNTEHCPRQRRWQWALGRKKWPNAVPNAVHRCTFMQSSLGFQWCSGSTFTLSSQFFPIKKPLRVLSSSFAGGVLERSL